MGQKTVRFSDLSGQLIMREDALARIVIHEHPDLGGDGPVEIEAMADEDLPRRVTMDADAFGLAVTEKPVGEMLAAARPVKRAGRPRLARAGGQPTGSSRGLAGDGEAESLGA